MYLWLSFEERKKKGIKSSGMDNGLKVKQVSFKNQAESQTNNEA